MHDGQGGFPLIPTFLAEESFLDVFPYNAGNQLRTLEGDVVDAVFQPDNLAPWHGPGGSGDAGFPSLQPFHCCGVAALPGGQEQHRTLHPGVQLGRVVLPQGFDDSYVVLAAELRTDCIVLQYGKVGENSFLQGNRVLIAPRFGTVALWGLTSPGSLSIFTCYSQNSWESIGISTIR